MCSNVEDLVLSFASDISGMPEASIRSSGYLCDVMEYEVFTDVILALERHLGIKFGKVQYEIENIRGLVALTTLAVEARDAAST